MNTLSCIHSTPAVGVGKVKKMMSLRTSDEERQARIREKQISRMQAKRMAMIQAVEQAVTLPEPLPKPLPKPIAAEEVTENTAPTEQISTEQTQRRPIGAMMGSIGSLIDRMRTFVLEE